MAVLSAFSDAFCPRERPIIIRLHISREKEKKKRKRTKKTYQGDVIK